MLIQKVIAVIMMIYQGLMAFAQMMASSYFVMALHLFIVFFIYEKLYRPTKALRFAQWGLVVSVYLLLYSIAAIISGNGMYNLLFFSFFAVMVFDRSRAF